MGVFRFPLFLAQALLIGTLSFLPFVASGETEIGQRSSPVVEAEARPKKPEGVPVEINADQIEYDQNRYENLLFCLVVNTCSLYE